MLEFFVRAFYITLICTLFVHSSLYTHALLEMTVLSKPLFYSIVFELPLLVTVGAKHLQTLCNHFHFHTIFMMTVSISGILVSECARILMVWLVCPTVRFRSEVGSIFRKCLAVST